MNSNNEDRSDCANAHSDLSLRWAAHMSEGMFSHVAARIVNDRHSPTNSSSSCEVRLTVVSDFLCFDVHAVVITLALAYKPHGFPQWSVCSRTSILLHRSVDVNV